ncbi:hypothetical protein [Microbacterium sp.]|uniref:hypothetical protein n=1 Tax=Microbacterium sp. TaxID=51671 RepID=UPI0039E50AC4
MQGERGAIAAFFRRIDRGDFVALPPDPQRYDQGEGHAEARAVAKRRRIGHPHWVFWHRQTDWVFDGDGDLTAGLLIHWGGDHARVRATLSGIPAPFRIVDHGPGGAFEIVSDALAARNEKPFPDPSDTAAVKDRIRRLTAPLEKRRPEGWSSAERDWLAAVLAHGDLAAQAYAVRWAVQIPDLDDEAFEALMSDWKRIYSHAPRDVLVWTFLDALAAREDPRLDEVLDECERRKSSVFRGGAAYFLLHRALPEDLERLHRLAQLTPVISAAVQGWVKVRAAVDGRDARDVAAQALSDGLFSEAAAQTLARIAERGIR